jgi:hypothetical protein
MKKFLSLILVLVLSMSLMTPAMAATTPKYTEEAETLYELGLFRGTGTNADGTPIFSLENNCTRLQALIILTRLLGLEDEALATTEPNPFTDIDNSGVGAKYVAYAYSTGLTNGIGEGKFGNTNVTPAQFTTFVLRALGYDDSKGDFKVSTAIEKGREIGLISDDLTISGNTLLRDECVKINYNALKTAIKDSDKLLAEKLIEDGTLTEFNVQNSEILSKTIYVPYDSANRRILGKDLKKAFPEGAFVKYGNIIRDASFEQIDFSPRNILLQDDAIKSYILDDFDPTSNAHMLREDTLVPVSFGGNASIITILDKDLHLIGYCVTSKNVPNSELEFKTCHLDNMKEIQEIKEKAIKISRSTPKFDESLVWCEVFVTEKDNEYTIGNCPAQLKFETEKLPEKMKDKLNTLERVVDYWNSKTALNNSICTADNNNNIQF